MDLNDVISQLRLELNELDEAIGALERLEASHIEGRLRTAKKALPETVRQAAGRS